MQRALELKDLPTEIHLHILDCLKNDAISLINVSHLDHYWRSLVRSELVARDNEFNLQKQIHDIESTRFTSALLFLQKMDLGTRRLVCVALVLFELMGIAAGPSLVYGYRDELGLDPDDNNIVIYGSAALVSGLAAFFSSPILMAIGLLISCGVMILIELYQDKKHAQRSRFAFFKEISTDEVPDLEAGEKEKILEEESEGVTPNYRSINPLS